MRVLEISLCLMLIVLGAASDDSYDPYNPYNVSDCRNQTTNLLDPKNGTLRVLSWHIHYTTNASAFPAFVGGIQSQFPQYFPPDGIYCPFGPNYILETYPYICNLEGRPESDDDALPPPPSDDDASPPPPSDDDYGNPWPFPQGAFLVPNAIIDEIWDYALTIQNGTLDLMRHGNSGCTHDDHGLRATWVLGPSEVKPDINYLDFPCNWPARGCDDWEYDHSASCGCDTPLNSDAPQDSCVNCARYY